MFTLKGNQILQKIFCCFKLDLDDVEKVTDVVLDIGEKHAEALNDRACHSLEGKVPGILLRPIHNYAENIIHHIREDLDANIGNEEMQVTGHAPQCGYPFL
jgi:hypothetical protein